MERREEDLIKLHAAHDAELNALYHEHLQLKHRLQGFREKIHLNTEEEFERRRIQKLKLASKDRIMAILDRYQHLGN
ncbi:MAG TPA: hypothetical protein VGI47_04710 [Candidatus Binataceae bacterium]|jgi:hypothetical protein